MRETIKRNIHKYAVGRAIFCPGCKTILDVDHSVLAYTMIRCKACWRKRIDSFAAKEGYEYTVKHLHEMEKADELVVGKNVGRYYPEKPVEPVTQLTLFGD